MNVVENNKLIAEFMEKELSPITLEQFRKLKQRDKHLINGSFVEDLCYHNSWNWLMSVVEKIENLKTPITNNPNLLGKFVNYEFHLQNKHIKIYAHGEVTKEIVDLSSSESETKIEAVYKACVKFINWYNKQK